MRRVLRVLKWGLAPLLVAGSFLSAQAAPVSVTVTVQNMSPNATLVIPLFSSLFHDGSGSHSFHDYFNVGDNFPLNTSDALDGGCSVSDPQCVFLRSVVRGDVLGITSAVQLAADPSGTPVTLGSFLLPGQSDSTTVVTDDGLEFFSYFAKLVPTNDSFIGSDDAIAISSLFGLAVGDSLPFISVHLSDIINLGVEDDNLIGSVINNGDEGSGGIDEDRAVSVGTSDFSIFNGALTDSGIFDFLALSSDPEILRITLTLATAPVVAATAPGPIGILGLSLIGVALVRRKRAA